MVVIGHVARGVDALHTRPEVLVDDDAVVDLHSGAGEEIRDRLGAKAHHDEVAFDCLSDATTSEPMKPTPTTTAFRPEAISTRMRSLSATVRKL
jgi:hypothetical protein